jgi:hypothetical protein
MKLSCDDIISYRCPRWADMPTVDLYIDQVVLFLHDSLSVFYRDEKNPVITAAMINNYVKLKVLPPPVNKKYNKGHMASLFVICILKRFMSISDIGLAISGMQRIYETSVGYDLFCDEFEAALERAFVPGSARLTLYSESDKYEVAALRAMVAAYADIVLSEKIMEAGRASMIKAMSNEKKKKKEEAQNTLQEKDEKTK